MLSTIVGTQVVSRADAEKHGDITGVALNAKLTGVAAWKVGKGRKAHFADHKHITGIGDAAVILDDAANLREPAEGVEKSIAAGDLSLLGATVLTEAGDIIGTVSDADLDTDAGTLLSVTSDAGVIEAARLLGFGTFALVVSVPS